MTINNVDFSHMIAMGIQSKTITRKVPSGIPYLVSLTPKMSQILAKRVEEVPLNTTLFWDQTYKYEAWRQKIQRRFNVIRKLAGAPHVTIYSLRSSGATYLLDNGIDVETVREKYGWTTLRMLPIYAKRSLAHQVKAQKLMEDEDKEIIL